MFDNSGKCFIKISVEKQEVFLGKKKKGEKRENYILFI